MQNSCSQSSPANRHSPPIPCPFTMNFGYFSTREFEGSFPDIDPDFYLFARSRALAASDHHIYTESSYWYQFRKVSIYRLGYGIRRNGEVKQRRCFDGYHRSRAFRVCSSTSQFKGFPLEIAKEAMILGIETDY
jgi:hypothetical protein